METIVLKIPEITKYNHKYIIYDYSKSNIKILNNNGYLNTEHLLYIVYKNENELLTKLKNTTNKLYDFGIIGVEKGMVDRRKKIIEYIRDNTEYTVKIIEGWKENRDRQIAECRLILNIHGWFNNEASNIFEHIRCDRLLEAGFTILSEESYELDKEFQDKYPNLHIIAYTDFFNKDILNNIKPISNNSNNIMTKKIIDCFTFYNELDLLEYRLNVLNDVVDYFVIVEANQTFVGKQKELYFNNNKELFNKFKDKIIHIIVDLPHITNINIYNNEQWINEKYQRNCIELGIDKIKLNDSDLIIIGDLDEIPDPQLLQDCKQNNKEIHINALEQDFFYYNLNNRHYNKWYLAKILSYYTYKYLSTKCDNIRFINCPNLERGGWHLSYFGSAEFIKNKIEQFSHQEYNNEKYTDIKSIEYKINNNMDLYDRENDKTEYVSVKNNTYLPPLYDSFLTNFYRD